MSLRRRGWRVLEDARGVSLVEIMVTAFISAIILSGVYSLYATARQGFDFGVSQAYVQRQGTLLQEQIARWAKNSVGVQVTLCGGNTTPGRSLAIAEANGTMRCIYQKPEAADTDAGLFVCQIGTWTAPCTGGFAYNALNVMPNQIAAPLRVRNTTFAPVTCIDGNDGPCGSGKIARSVTSPLVDVRFDLTDNTIFSPQSDNPTTPYIGMRFGFSVTARN